MAFDQSLRNSQIVISYSRNIGIRKRIFEFEEALSNQFNTPFKTVAIPDELDPNIPRFESQSRHGHSKLQVSQNRMNLATTFDGKLSNEEIKSYLVEKRKALSNLANTENINFIAYVLELTYLIPEEKINNILKENTGAKSITDECRDFTLLYSRSFREKYYLNITCSKFSEKEMIFNSTNQELRETDNVRHGISVKVDLNTKYFYEMNNKFINDLYSSLETVVFDLIAEKDLTDYLKGNI